MSFTAQNFVDKQGPAVSASWLNGVDVTVNFVLGGAQTLTQAQTTLGIGQAQTPAEIEAGVTPTYILYPPLDPRRYGLTGTDLVGATNLTAINNAVAVATAGGGGIIPYPVGLFYVNGSINDVANVTHQGQGIIATQIQMNASVNLPVFVKAGSSAGNINGGGIQKMTIFGSWSSAAPSVNTACYGISCIGSNGALYSDLRIEACDVGFYGQYNYESRCVRVKMISGAGVNPDACNIGFVMDVNTLSSGNINNGIYFTECEATYTWGDGWQIRNGNGSLLTSCSAEACGQSGTQGYGFNIGSSSALSVPCRFINFVNCVGDSCLNGNWLVQASSASRTSGVYDLYFANCWSGQTAGNGWAFVNVLDCSVIGGNSDSASFCGIQCTNSPITIVGFTARNFNVGANGSAGINLINTQGAIVANCNIQTTNLTGPPVGIAENGTSNYNNLQNNTMLQTGTTTGLGMLVAGANTICRNNQGFVTEASGNASFTAATTATVTHGLGFTPSAQDLTLTCSGNYTAWVSGITSTQFTINLSASSTTTVGWSAHYLRH